MACISGLRGWISAEYPDVTDDVLKRLTVAGLHKLADIIGGFKWFYRAKSFSDILSLEVPEGFRVIDVERVSDVKGCIAHKRECLGCKQVRLYDAQNGTVALFNGTFSGDVEVTYRLQVKASGAPREIPDDLYDQVAPIVADYIKAKLALADTHNRSARRIGEDFMAQFTMAANAYKRELSHNGRNQQYIFKGVSI